MPLPTKQLLTFSLSIKAAKKKRQKEPTSDKMIFHTPINVKPTGGRQGIGRGFDIFQKIAVKFPTRGQKCEIKYNWNSPPREMICGHGHEQKFKYPYARDSKIIQMPYPGP